MREKDFLSLIDYFNSHKKILHAVKIISTAITLSVYLFYPLMLAYLFFTKNVIWLKYFLVPFISFVAVSVARKLINKKRPYELYNFAPLLKSPKKGCSLPSRHTFSVFVIGFSTLFVNVPLGIAIIALGVLLAVSRVLLCAHFPIDVITGFLCAAVSMIIGFIII